MNKNLFWLFEQVEYEDLNYRTKFVLHTIASVLDYLREENLIDKDFEYIYEMFIKKQEEVNKK